MDGERADQTQEQFRDDEIQGEAAQSGYPEEEPGGTGGASDSPLGRSGGEPIEKGDSPSGASGEGTQSTGNPNAAG